MKHLSAFFLLFFITYASQAQKYFTPNVVHHWQTIIPEKAIWRYFPGTSEPDTNWRKTSFIDTTWSLGKAGIGYGDNDDSTIISSPVTSLYMRKSFTISDSSKIWDMILTMDYDDGFVAYLNGTEVARSNIGTVGTIPRHDSLAASSHEAIMYQGGNPSYFIIPKSTLIQCLTQGNNVLCIQVHNASATSDDLTARPHLHAGINDKTTPYLSNPSWFSPPLASHLPLIFINTNGNSIPNEPKLICTMGIVENGINQNHKTDVFNHYNGKIGIETRGSSSAGFPQKSYGISLYDSNGVNNNKKLLGFPKEHDFILYAPYTDKSLMRNNLVYELSREMGWYASRCLFVELFINGQYQGIYVLMETIKTDKNRIDIADMDTSSNTGDAVTGGYIMKIDRVKQSGLGVWTSPITNFQGKGKSYQLQTVEPDIPDLTSAQRNYIKPWMDNFENTLNGNGYSNTLSGFKRLTDVNSFIDNYILNEWTRNVDAYRLSCFFYKQRESLGGRLYMAPVWDFNIALGNANYCNGYDTTGWNDCGYSSMPFWFERMMQDNDYKKQLVCRWKYYRNTIMKQSRLENWIDSVAAYLEVPQQRHYQTYQILGTYVWPNYYIGNTYQDEVNYLKKYMRGRLNWMDKNMPKVLPVCNSSSSGSLTISEIMYNCDTLLNGGNWIEIYNNSQTNISLANYVLRDGSGFRSFTIPTSAVIPGKGYIVIVEDTAAFRNIYPNVKNIYGPTHWGLNNDSGFISLYDASNYRVCEMSYSDRKPWPQLADGKKRSLELKSYGSQLSNPLSWRNGCIGGTPGSAGICSEKLWITEINYNSHKNYDAGDWFEIYNSDSVPMDLSHWKIRDNNDSNVFSFKSGSIIQPYEYIVFSQDTSKFKKIYPGINYYPEPLNFSLNSSGDEIRIYDSTDKKYTEVIYSDSFPFPYGAKGTGKTIELRDSVNNLLDGSNWALSCFLGTPGRKRDHLCLPPAPPPGIRITEFNPWPDPASNDAQWTELYNNGKSKVLLKGFKILSSVSTLYTFTDSIWLDTGQFIIIANDTAKFRKTHGINSYGNWISSLNINNDSIRIADTAGNLLMSVYYNTALFPESYLTGRTILSTDTGKTFTSGCIYGNPASFILNCAEPSYISEIATYNTAGGFIEFINPFSQNFSLDGYRIRYNTDTISSEIKPSSSNPGSRTILVANNSIFKNIFRNRYIHGNLHNAPDTSGMIKLYNNSGLLVQILKYGSNWSDSGKIAGFSWEYIGSGNPDLSTSWYSTCLHGTPALPPGIGCYSTNLSSPQITEMLLMPDYFDNRTRWIELYNSEKSTISIHEFDITQNGQNVITFNENTSLNPGDFIIISDDSAIFRKKYNYTGTIFQFDSPLNDTGEFIIFSPFNMPLNRAVFRPTQTNRGIIHAGYGLHKLKLNSDGSDPNAWIPGCVQGSPGSFIDSCAFNWYINEVNYNSISTRPSGSWIEIYNSDSKKSLNLSDYIIRTHDNEKPIQIPNKFIIQAGSYGTFVNDSNLFSNVYINPGLYIQGLPPVHLDSPLVRMYNPKGMLEYSLFFESDTPWNTLANGKGYTLGLNYKPGSNLCNPVLYTTNCPDGTPGFDNLNPCKNTGIFNNTLLNQLYVYPVPASHVVFFRIPNTGNFLTISDLSGKILFSQTVKDELTAWPVQSIPQGMYFWKYGELTGRIMVGN